MVNPYLFLCYCIILPKKQIKKKKNFLLKFKQVVFSGFDLFGSLKFLCPYIYVYKCTKLKLFNYVTSNAIRAV